VISPTTPQTGGDAQLDSRTALRSATVVTSSVSSPATTFGVLIFFVLAGGYLVRRQLLGL